MRKSETVNTFPLGLLMDLNPLVTPNNVLTNCLNGTLITYNGNENVLLNDMGNGRVETAYLPEGYIPLGTTELGGIIYIVSYNPLIKKCLIGSFPSPERNITSDELGKSNKLECSKFYDGNSMDVIVNTLKIMLTDKELHAGDKFCISSDNLTKKDTDTNDYILSAYDSTKKDIDDLPRLLKLHIVSIQDDGKIVYLDDNLTWFEDYYIHDASTLTSNGVKNLDEYRLLVNSNYSVFSSKVAGKLAILAELEAVDTFSAAIKVNVTEENDLKLAEISFDTNWTYLNRNPKSKSKINPKGVHVIASNRGSLELFMDDYDEESRKNDGTDPAVSVTYKEKNEVYKFPYTPGGDSQKVTFTLSPWMEYGYLKYLETSITIDLSKLGSGITDLTEYRYFVEDLLFTLSYSFDSYPEMGKEVKQVKFNFYPFSESIYDNIKSVGRYMDESYIVKKKDGSSKWKNGNTENTEIDDGNLTEFELINNSNSILGHFSERVYFDDTEKSGLKLNLCYLVKITVNYNDEEDRIYYRLLYTSNIFNSAYYTENNFNNLKLSEYLRVLPKVSNLEITSSKGRREIKLDNNIISEIPNMLPTPPGNPIIYTIEDAYSNTVNCNIQIISNYSPSLFTFKIKSATEESSAESNPISKLLYIVEEDNTLKISAEPEVIWDNKEGIVETIKDGYIEYSREFLNIITTPIKVKYDKTHFIPIQFELLPLSGGIYYLSANGNAENLRIGIDDVWQHPEEGIASSSTGDNHTKTFSNILSMPGIGPVVLELLQSRDWIALCCNYWYNKHDDCKLTYSYSNTKIEYGYNGSGHKGEGTLPVCFVVFALKSDTSVDTIIFRKFYGSEYTTDVVYDQNKRIPMSNLSSSNFSSDIYNTFGSYYKLLNYSGTGKINYIYSDIVYWENYTVETILNAKFTTENELSISNISITTSPIKNLIYDKSAEIDLLFTASKRINLDDILYLIMNTESKENYVFLNDKIIETTNALSNKKVYQVIDEEIKEARISLNLLLKSDGNSVAIKNNTSDKLKISILWDSEDLGLRIKNITIVEDNGKTR